VITKLDAAREQAEVVLAVAQPIETAGHGNDTDNATNISLASYRQQLSALLQQGAEATQQRISEIIRLTALIAIFVIDITASANDNNYLQQLSENQVFANIPIPESVRGTIQSTFSNIVNFAADVSNRALTISDLIRGVERAQGEVQGNMNEGDYDEGDYGGSKRRKSRKTKKSKKSRKSKKSKRRRTHRRK
jgi:hypothetical protein